MKEIVERLTENKQIELAKSILENAGYTVTKPQTSTRGMKRYLVFYFKKSSLDQFCEDYNIVDEDPFSKPSLNSDISNYGELIGKTNDKSEADSMMEQTKVSAGDVVITYDFEEDVWFES